VRRSTTVGASFVASLARPGGNATGFTSFEYGLSGKWLELLKQIAPSMTRAAVLCSGAQFNLSLLATACRNQGLVVNFQRFGCVGAIFELSTK
jgi:hypothetical protein